LWEIRVWQKKIMSEEYDFVAKGKLNLKSDSQIKKKKKKEEQS